jgi:hypothetical protein
VYSIIVCDKGYQSHTASHCFSPGTPVSSINKTDRHDIAEILLKVALNTTALTPKSSKLEIVKDIIYIAKYIVRIPYI